MAVELEVFVVEIVVGAAVDAGSVFAAGVGFAVAVDAAETETDLGAAVVESYSEGVVVEILVPDEILAVIAAAVVP